MNKKIFTFILLLIFTLPLIAQETASEQSGVAVTEGEEISENPFNMPFFETSNLFIGFTPLLFITTDNENKGGPSSIVYPLYIGVSWPRDFWISLQPSIKIFMDYYLVNDGTVYPAEIENRTGLGFAFLLNIPVVFQANFWDMSNLKLSAGLAFLIRFAVPAPGVPSSAPGSDGFATVKDEVSYINKSFYEGAKFIYLSGSADFMFNLNNGVQIGPEFSMYIPVITILSEFSLHGTMFSAGVKLIF